MSFIQGLHGTVALLLLCSLLFAEEAGVPLPFAPGEITLIVAGLLIAAGGLNPYIFLPFAVASCLGGELVGYSWAALVGPRTLEAVADRLHQRKPYERVASRLREADALQIAISRLIPGLRIYTTLVAGAVGVRRRTFLLGVGPATVVWVALFVVLGAAVGVPVEHVFNSVARLALQGGILLIIGVGGYFAIRKIPTSDAAGIVTLPHQIRICAAAIIDIAVVASIVTGIVAVGRRVFGLGLRAGWVDGVVALVMITVFYVFVTRRSAGGTVGESLLRTTYVTGRDLPLRPRSALIAARELFSRSDDALAPTADLLRALGDPHRLRLLVHLAESPMTASRLASDAGMAIVDVQHDLARLQGAGAVERMGGELNPTYSIAPNILPLLSELERLDESMAETAARHARGLMTLPDGQAGS